MKTLEKILKYIKVSPMDNAITTFFIGTAAYPTYITIKSLSQGKILWAILSTSVAGAEFYFASSIQKRFAVPNFEEYKKIKTALEEHGWDERIIKPKSHTWCQRRMSKVAAKDVGLYKEIKEYFKREGYRWYHIFPIR